MMINFFLVTIECYRKRLGCGLQGKIVCHCRDLIDISSSFLIMNVQICVKGRL
jgi:hypothetical protein